MSHTSVAEVSTQTNPENASTSVTPILSHTLTQTYTKSTNCVEVTDSQGQTEDESERHDNPNDSYYIQSPLKKPSLNFKICHLTKKTNTGTYILFSSHLCLSFSRNAPKNRVYVTSYRGSCQSNWHNAHCGRKTLSRS